MEQRSSLTGTTGAESLRWVMGGDDAGEAGAPGSMAVTQVHACGLLLATGEWLRPAHWNIQVWAGPAPPKALGGDSFLASPSFRCSRCPFPGAV